MFQRYLGINRLKHLDFQNIKTINSHSFQLSSSHQFNHAIHQYVILDENNIAICSLESNSIYLYKIDLQPFSLKLIAELTEHKNPVTSLLHTTDGKLISGSIDKTIKIWDLTSLKCIRTLTGHDDSICSLSELSNRTIASAAKDKTIRIWDHQKSIKILNVDHPIDHTLDVGENQIVCSNRNSLAVITVTPQGTKKITLDNYSQQNSVIASNPCPLLLPNNWMAVAKNNEIQIWDVTHFQLIKTLVGHKEAITHLLLQPDNSLLSLSNDTTIKVWDVWREICLETHEFSNNRMKLISLLNKNTILQDNACIYVSTYENTIKCFGFPLSHLNYKDIEPHLLAYFQSSDPIYRPILDEKQAEQPHLTSSSNATQPVSINLSNCGEINEKEQLRLLNLYRKNAIANITYDFGGYNEFLTSKIHHVNTFKNNSSDYHDKHIQSIYQKIQNKTLIDLTLSDIISHDYDTSHEISSNAIFTAITSLPGNRLAICLLNDTSQVRIIDLLTGKTIQILTGDVNNAFSHLIFLSPNKLLGVTVYKRIIVWDLENFKKIRIIHSEGEHSNHKLAISPDNRFLACGSIYSQLQIWDIENDFSPVYMGMIKYFTNTIRAFIFLKNNYLAFSYEKTFDIAIWDFEHDKLICEIPDCHSGSIDILFSIPNTDSFISGSSDHKLKIWNKSENNTYYNKELTGHTGPITAINRLPTGEIVSASSNDQNINIWNPHSGNISRVLKQNKNIIHDIVVLPDGTIISCSNNIDLTSPTNNSRKFLPSISRAYQILACSQEHSITIHNLYFNKPNELELHRLFNLLKSENTVQTLNCNINLLEANFVALLDLLRSNRFIKFDLTLLNFTLFRLKRLMDVIKDAKIDVNRLNLNIDNELWNEYENSLVDKENIKSYFYRIFNHVHSYNPILFQKRIPSVNTPHPQDEKNDNLSSADNNVIVRIWTKNSECVGHVSIETHGKYGYYISLWPSKDKLLNTLFGISSMPARTLKDDIRDENGRQPTKTFTFKTLDTQAINNVYTVLHTFGINYKLFASSIIKDLISSSNEHNCVSLALYLLNEGGFYHLVEDANAKQNQEQLSYNITMMTHVGIVAAQATSFALRFFGANRPIIETLANSLDSAIKPFSYMTTSRITSKAELMASIFQELKKPLPKILLTPDNFLTVCELAIKNEADILSKTKHSTNKNHQAEQKHATPSYQR